MIPIAIEPTRLGFNTYCHVKGCQQTGKEVLGFVRRVVELSDSLEQHGLCIAITSDLQHVYESQFPFSECLSGEYSPSVRAVIKNAVPLFQLKRERWRKVHEYGQHQMDIGICSGVNDPRGMLASDDSYLEWLDLLGRVVLRDLPPFILREHDATVFCDDTCLIEAASSKENATAHVAPDLDSACAHQGLALWRLAYLIRDDGETAPDSAPCSGTGTHSSMWDKKIQSLDDVPAMERSLLKAVAALGLVEEICLLSFNQPRPAVSSPAIESLEVQQGTENVLKGLLRGKGKKQNAQQITLTLRGNYASLLKTAMGDGIDLPRLERLKQAIRRLNGKSGKPSKKAAP